MKKLILLMLLFGVYSVVGAEEPSSIIMDNAESMALLIKEEFHWSVYNILNSGGAAFRAVFTGEDGVIDELSRFGRYLLFLFFVFEVAKMLYEKDTNWLNVLKLLAPTAIIGAMLSSVSSYDYITRLIVAPMEAVLTALKGTGVQVIIDAKANAFKDYAEAVQDDSWGILGAIAKLTVSSIVGNIMLGLGLIISWVMSLYISMMWTIFYCIGPILIPTLIFRPLSSLFWNWIKTMISYSMMGVLGMLLTVVISSLNFLSFMTTSAGAGDMFTSLTTSIIVFIAYASIPTLGSQITGGISSSFSSAMRSAKTMASGMATGAAIGTGAGLMAGGGLASGIDKVMSGGSVSNRASTGFGTPSPSGMDVGVSSGGSGPDAGFSKPGDVLGGQTALGKGASKMSSLGRNMIKSQIPGFSKMASRGGNSSSSKSGSYQEAGAVNERSGSNYSDPNKGVSSQGGGSTGGNNTPREKVDWRNKVENSSIEENQAVMMSQVSNSFKANPEVAEAFAEKLKTDEWKGVNLEAKGASGSYQDVVRPQTMELLEKMGIKPNLASDLKTMNQKSGGKNGFSFERNSPEANKSLMKDFVSQRTDAKGQKQFSELLDKSNVKLSGSSKKPLGDVARAVGDVYKEAGVNQPFSQYKNQVSEKPVNTSFGEVDINKYNSFSQAEKKQYHDELMVNYNNGQYADYKDLVNVDPNYKPIQRQGQSFDEATIGMLKAVMMKQGLIGKKDN